MEHVHYENGIYVMTLNDRIITQESLCSRGRQLYDLIKHNRDKKIKLLIKSFNASYDSDETHSNMGKTFEKELAEFNQLPRQTAIYNHYREDYKFDYIRFFTDYDKAYNWLQGE